ncbi:MAG: hydrogenase maturation nickel metallochaperone HypA [Acidobacteria bacterium]|nr:MAG: hydrogenase maturation nickel metallochaperone HypA [Acidobacteriota bacterium]
MVGLWCCVHELSIAQSLVESVRAEMSGHADARVARIGLKVGDLSGVQPDALRFSFEIIVRGTELEQAALDIERVPLTCRCAACNTDFPVLDYRTCCPGCGGEAATPVSGGELQLTYLELE